MTLSQALRHAPTTVGNFWPKVPASNPVNSACAASALTAVFQAMDCQLLQRGYIARCGQHRMRHTVFLPTAYCLLAFAIAPKPYRLRKSL